MMSYATNEYTIDEIYTMIIEYQKNLIAANRLKNEYIDLIAGGNISRYGIESSMPKAVGQTSDPTYNEIRRLIKQDAVIDRFENRVLYIQNRWDRIVKKNNEDVAVVFHMALTGRSIKYMSELTQNSPRKVKILLLEAAEILQD